MLNRSTIQSLLQQRDRASIAGEANRAEDNSWSVWFGSDPRAATQLLNDDGSSPYVRKVQVSDQMFAIDSRFTITSELYRVTLVSESEPNANAKYWLSIDGGATKDAVRWVKRESKCKRSFWWIFLANDN